MTTRMVAKIKVSSLEKFDEVKFIVQRYFLLRATGCRLPASGFFILEKNFKP